MALIRSERGRSYGEEIFDVFARLGFRSGAGRTFADAMEIAGHLTGLGMLRSSRNDARRVPDSWVTCQIADHSRRFYRNGLLRFFAWVRLSGSTRVYQGARGPVPELSSGAGAQPSLHQPPSLDRPAASREMSDNGLLDPAVAAVIERVSGVERRGTRIGNWLGREQANELLNAPKPRTLIGCGLRRAEQVSLHVDSIQQLEARWVSRTCWKGWPYHYRHHPVRGSRPVLISGPARSALPKAGCSGP